MSENNSTGTGDNDYLNDPQIEEEEEDVGPLPFENDIEEDELEEDGENELNGANGMTADHPLFKKLNDDIKRQLNQQSDDLDVQIRDKTALRNQLSNDREQVGVELYTIQQHLAKLHQRLTDANTAREAAEADRIEQEKALKEEREILKQAQDELLARTREYEKQRTDLDKLNETVLLLEKENEKVADEKQVAKRKAYKSEQSATQTEVAKQEQDLYINRLTEQIQEVSSQLSVLDAQILAQRGETKTARDALLQANLEMEKVSFEKNHLIQDWNSALLLVKKRSITLQEIEQATAKQDEEIRSLQNEESGLKKQIQKQQEETEKNTLMLNKITSRIQYLDGKINEASEERQSLQKQLENLYAMVHEKEIIVSRLLVERNNVKNEFNNSLKGTNEISNQIHQIEDTIIKQVTEQSNLKRETVAAQHKVEGIRDQIVSKDRELANLQNEVVRLKIDKLNIGAQTDKLKVGLNEILEELKQKDKLISQYETQIRKNTVDIEKRQGEVDKLNRLFESLKNEQNGEELGPLERAIRDLTKKASDCDETIQESQTNWLKKQTELVQLSKASEELEKQNNTITAHIAVLTRKRDRIDNQLKATEKEIARYQEQIRLHQREMSKLGEKLNEQNANGTNLTEGNINMEADILNNLQKLEEEAAKAETQIEELAAARENLAEDLMETEKSIMMWEKKLQLAKEMREALDPNYGAAELKSMKKDISRMELRLKQIKKQQQLIIQEMEYALNRRETIATKSQVKGRSNKDRTNVEVTKGIKGLQSEIKRLQSESAKLDASMRENVELQKELGAEIEQFAHMERETKQSVSEAEKQLHEEEKAKLTNQSKLERLQAKQRLFAQKNAKNILKSTDGFEQAFDNLKQQENQLTNLMDMISNDFPHLSENIQYIKDRVMSD
ncbi:Coiled-coil domain-containing protein 40 [Tritrichomonas musculus]|uniref:Coiled-coil domain-containing protein 40 n=1 Tax=Tritrichomonas musculus TaxID=1915356 RepID=A0ABR2K693_9EUKA